jgi:hypothetical protein
MYMCVYIHTHTHTSTHTCMHVCMHVTYNSWSCCRTFILSSYVYICIHVYTHTRTHTHIHAHTHTYIHACTHACDLQFLELLPHIHSVTHTYIHTHIHTYIHTYIHTCMHTYIELFRGPQTHVCMHVTYNSWSCCSTFILSSSLSVTGMIFSAMKPPVVVSCARVTRPLEPCQHTQCSTQRGRVRCLVTHAI